MSEWIVYSKDGLTERCRLKRLEYNGSFMNERTISATFEYHSEVAFDVFDYIVYRNEKFELESIPSVKKISNHNYEYELRFVSLKYELERCEMRDIVPNDNGVTYPTPLTFSFTGDVRYLTERIQANLDSLYGEGVWSIVITEGVKSEEKNITISQQNCWNALSLVNTTYNLTFSIKGRVITVGGEQSLVGHVFQYGKGKGLYEIERVSDTDTGIVTKVRAYGGTRNLDYSYPKRPEWTDSVLPVSFALSPLRLMLPSFKLDGKTDYVLADDSIISEYGIREASIVYDDIYPSITGMRNTDDEPIDEIKSVDEVDDSKDTFVVYLYDLGFDLESNLTTENAQISMKSGSLIGYTFNISEIEKQEDNSYKITLGRITNEEGDTGNFNIPNSQWSIAAGDKFVLLNILMPQEYIRNAEERLLERAKEYLNEYGRTNFSYNVGLHDKFLKENADIYKELIEGSKLRIYDQNLGISEDVTIQSITITENMGDNMLTQVKVTLNNKPSASTIERIQGQIKELSETSAGQFSTQSELLKQYRRKLDKPFFDRLFAAVDINGNEIPSTDLSTPIAYIKARYSVASIGGFTMYLNDNSYNLPTIYDGLPIDNNTIYWENGILKAKGGGGVAESVSWADITGKPEWLLDGKISYSEIEGTPDLSVYALSRSLSAYVTKTELSNLDYADKDWVKEYVVDINTGNITAITKQMVIEALGYTPVSSSDVPTALPNPHSLKFGSKLYDGSSSKTILASDLGITWDDILGRPTLLSSFTDDVVAGKYLPLSGGTITGEIKFNISNLTSSDISPNIIAAFKAPRVQANDLFVDTITLGTTSGTASSIPLKIRKYSKITSLNPDGITDLVIVDPNGSVNIGTTTHPCELNVEGDAKANRFVATSNNGLRLAYGDYGTLLRNDGDRFFILLTNKGDALNGSFNTLRPFGIDLATGDIQMESNVFITKSFKLSKRLRVDAREAAVSFGYLKSNIANANNIGIAHLGTNYGGTTDMTREDLDMTAISMYRGIVGIGKEYDYTSLRAIYDAGVDLGLTKGLLIGSAKVLYENNELNISTSAYINGNILTTGGVTMYSQKSLKDVVDEEGLTLEQLKTIKPTRYTWKDNRDNRIHFGGIADDIQQVLPEVVYNANGVLTMDYGNAGFAIASSLIKPVVDHEQRIKALEKETEELKQEIKRLRS